MARVSLIRHQLGCMKTMYGVVHYDHQPLRDVFAACAIPGGPRPRTIVCNLFSLSPRITSWYRIYFSPTWLRGEPLPVNSVTGCLILRLWHLLSRAHVLFVDGIRRREYLGSVDSKGARSLTYIRP